MQKRKEETIIETDIEKAIKKAEGYGFGIIENNGGLFISTPKSNWWIDLSKEDKIILWHKNFRNTNKKSNKVVSDYHYQKKLKSINEGIQYIKRHDEYKYTVKDKGKYRKQNNRLDYLFSKIASE